MKLKFANALSLALIMAMLITSLALADNVQDDVSGAGPVAFVAGNSTTINYSIQDTGSNGCGANDSTPVTITVNAPAGRLQLRAHWYLMLVEHRLQIQSLLFIHQVRQEAMMLPWAHQMLILLTITILIRRKSH